MKCARFLEILAVASALTAPAARADEEANPSPQAPAAALSQPPAEQPPAAADTSELEALLEESLVSGASRSAEAASVAPATATSVTAEDLRRYGIRSMDEAINFLSLGMITQNPLHSVDIGARGVLLTADFGNHVLLLVDGHAMNEQWDGTAYFERGAAIPFELIDHIEFILGPGSVLYGSNAMLGVVNVVTKRAKDLPAFQLVAESELPVSLRGGMGGGWEGKVLGRPVELTLQAEYYTQDGPAFSFGPQPYGNDSVTGEPKRFSKDGSVAGTWGGVADRSYYTRVPAFYGRLVSGNFEASARAAAYKRATPYVNGFNQLAGDFNDPDGYEMDRWVSLDLSHRAPLSSVVELRTRLYGDIYDYRQIVNSSAAEDCLADQVNGCQRRVRGASKWAGLESQLSADWLPALGLKTLFGADGRIRQVGAGMDLTDAVSGDNPGSIGEYTHQELALGVYLQQAARPVQLLSLNAGARLDVDQRFGHHLSPRAAASLGLWPGGTLKAIYSEAFRASSSYELFYSDPTEQIAADHLRPESVHSSDISIEQRHGTQRVLLGAFHSWWSDMVLLETLSPDELAAAIATGRIGGGVETAFQYRNAATIQNYGLNAAFEGSQLGGALRYGLNLTWAVAKRQFPDDRPALPLTVAPQLYGNARVSYRLPEGFPTLSLAALFVGRRPADRAFDGGFDPVPYAPQQLQLRAAASGDLPGIKGLRYRLSADMATAGRNPYVVGPLQAATPDYPSAQLSPVDRFRVALGLQYEL